MYELKFDPTICEKCKSCDCIMKCQYIDMDLEKAREEHGKLVRGEDSEILTQCVTCYACEEYCPYHNHPFYLIVERQEEKGIHPVPKPIEKSQVIMMAPKGRIEEKAAAEPVINLCYFPMLKGSIQGKLYEGTSLILGSDIFCNLMFLHFARNSVIKERLPAMMDNIIKYHLNPGGAKEFICYHDECYGTYTSWAPAFGIEVPFKPIHLFDFLYNRLKELKSDIKPLNIKAAYQRPCSSRLCPEMDHFVDDIFELIGVERVEREYDRENALCCGGVLEAQQRFELTEENQTKNIEDMKASGATHCVFNCPFCFFTLMGKVSEKGMTPILMSDLCRMALGE
jgi:Fe-S oxidoreductase